MTVCFVLPNILPKHDNNAITIQSNLSNNLSKGTEQSARIREVSVV